MSEIRPKPMLTAEDLITYMKIKGIKFNFITEDETLAFLNSNNNYFKLTSYRKNFIKPIRGDNAGKYLDLDFAYLVDLSTIDMHFRYLLLKICLDIEHFTKVRLIKLIDDNDLEDGYNIVKKFIDYQRTGNDGKNTALNDITRSVGSPYCGELLKSHNIDKTTIELNQFPIWAFIEVISFGALKSLYSYYHELYGIEDKDKIGFLLKTVNQLRNAVAHSNCIINNLYPENPSCVPYYSPDYKVMAFLSSAGIGKQMRESRMKNPRIKQIASTLYVFDKIITSEQLKKHRYKELKDLVANRMIKNKKYYQGNETIKSAYDFIYKLTMYLNNSFGD